jgi:hypothetical protein
MNTAESSPVCFCLDGCERCEAMERAHESGIRECQLDQTDYGDRCWCGVHARVLRMEAAVMDERRRFVRSETERLGRFLDVDHLVGWSREYRCGCGFRCYDAGSIWDHAQECRQDAAQGVM